MCQTNVLIFVMIYYNIVGSSYKYIGTYSLGIFYYLYLYNLFTLIYKKSENIIGIYRK